MVEKMRDDEGAAVPRVLDLVLGEPITPRR